ncbi:MAG: hypothetical protein LQ352_007123 [Teloschistes flavicans]|nr:MAG: hypothetical protein LQ352_007123 [Teloschistes flavicans]
MERHGSTQISSLLGDSNSGALLKPRDGFQAPFRDGREGRSLSNANVTFAPRGSSLAQGPPPGSFSSDLRSTTLPRAGTPRTEQAPFFAHYGRRDVEKTTEERQTELREQINKEIKIKVGSENLLEALVSKNNKQTKEQRLRVEAELGSSQRKIIELRGQLEEEISRSKRPKTPPRNRLSGLFQSSPARSPQKNDESMQDNMLATQESESPTYMLSEILQALENEGMQPDYYVERANRLVSLFKKYPSLKYDLAWPVFGLRIQTMLLSQSREVVAAGYRVTRHAIADRRSLQTVRRLNTDELVVLSLVKESKANIEREQALKFVRAFLDVKGGIHEVSNAVLRTIVSIAEHHEDRLRNLSILTLLEILVRNPSMAVNAGGMAPLTEALLDGSYQGSESLASAMLYLFDRPSDRVYLKSGHEIDAAFTIFTDPIAVHSSEEKLKSSARLITALMNSWPGLFALANDGFQAIRGLLQSLAYPSLIARDLTLDIMSAVLQIKAPSWSSSFLAGRRLTTYGRVANLTKENFGAPTLLVSEEEGQGRVYLTEHYIALVLVVLLQTGLQQALLDLIQEDVESAIGRKAALLHGEVLNLANRLLPYTFSSNLHMTPKLMGSVGSQTADTSLPQITMIYQADSVSRTLYRSQAAAKHLSDSTSHPRQQRTSSTRVIDPSKPEVDFDMDEVRFRAAIVETQILNHVKYIKWNWDLIEDIINGPLKNAKRLSEAITGTKFLKRLLGFYRPFKYRFSDASNTKANQRYVRVGVSLMKALLQNSEGIAHLSESKFLRQLGECLAQLDRTSGFTSSTPLFSSWRTTETLTGGYFALLGALSSNPKGLEMIERWHMVNIFYHIIDLQDRDDLVELLLGNMDFALDSHLRVMLSKALTACQKPIRIFSTKLLRQYATLAPDAVNAADRLSNVCEWAIRLLVTQLYDPEVEVSEAAVQILEESCNEKSRLEYLVRCRPQLDHLNEIGAPLLLRFLSTSLGYQYLDRLDYITQEMDDWYLGRNYSYVTLIEASLTRAFSMLPQDASRSSINEPLRPREYGTLPPHFYRELTHTREGCDLLRESGHFDGFVRTITDSSVDHEDSEGSMKLKGALWAVGNIGSMELGAPFLEESDVVRWIIQIAETSEVTTMRGTAFFVLGLISRSLHGMEIISEHGWIAATDQYGRSSGYCLPPTLGNLFLIKRSHDDKAGVRGMIRDLSPRPITDEDPVQARVLSFVVDAGNAVLAKKAANDLNGIKVRHPEVFSSVDLYRKVRDVLGSHNFRLPVRRFILDLFDRSVMRNVVLDEEESENESIRTQRPPQARPRLP